MTAPAMKPIPNSNGNLFLAFIELIHYLSTDNGVTSHESIVVHSDRGPHPRA